MTTLREAAQQALEYMKFIGKMDMHPEKWAIIGRLEAALAEPQEPDSPERRCGGPGCDMRCCQPVEEPMKLWPLAPLTGYYDVGGKRVWLEKDEPFPQPAPPQPAEPVQEPVGAVLVNRESREGVMFYSVDMIPDPSTLKDRFELVPVYTAPPQRPAEPVQQGCDHCNHPLYAAIKCRVCGRVTEQAEPVHLTGLSIRAQSTIGRWLNEDMDRAVANGANSISMPDELVEIAAWLHAQAAPSSGRMGSGVRNDPR